MSSEKRLHLPKRFAELCLYKTLNFDESRRISSFAITMQVIILSGSHWKIKYSTTLTLVKGLVYVNDWQQLTSFCLDYSD